MYIQCNDYLRSDQAQQDTTLLYLLRHKAVSRYQNALILNFVGAFYGSDALHDAQSSKH